MKKIIRILVCTAVIFAVSSCNIFNKDKPTKESKGITTIVELPDTVKQKIVEQDSLMKDLVAKIDELTTELNKSKGGIAKLSKSVESLEGPKSIWVYMTLTAIVIAIIALVLTFLKSKGVKDERVYKIVKDCLDDSRRIKELQVNVNYLLSVHRNGNTFNSNTTNHDIDSDVQQLKQQMMQVINFINAQGGVGQQPGRTTASQEQTIHANEPQNPKVGYAKIDTDIYFTTIYNSNQEGCVFKITFTSKTKGKFSIISLDKIQSRNDWQKKVECSGISIKDAGDFYVEEDGICEKIDDSTWTVTKPLKIKLLK